MKKCLLTLIGNQPQTKKKDTPKVQLGEPMSFIELMNRMDEGSLIGTEMTQIIVLPKAHPSMGNGSQTWKPGAYCTA